MAEQKSSSHLGVGLLIGTIMGVATGLFLQSKQGKTLIKDGEKKAKALQTKLMKELQDVQNLTKEKYEMVVDKTVDYYLKSKEIVAKDVPEIRKMLMRKWKEIEKQVQALKG